MATYPRLREQAERVDGAASYVAKASNLTDLTDAAAARSALGLGSAATMTPTTLAANSAFTGTYVQQGTRVAQDTMRATRDVAYRTWDALLADATVTPALFAYGNSVVAGTGASDQPHAFTRQLKSKVEAVRPGAITVNSSGIGGATSTALLAAGVAASFSALTAGSAGCLVLMALLNDYSDGIAPATSQSNLQSIIAAYRADAAAAPNMTVVIALEWLRTTASGGYAWDDYRSAAQAVADADPYTTVVDLGVRMGDASADALSLYGDGTHPTDRGHALIADLLYADLMRVPVRPVLPTHTVLTAFHAPTATVGTWTLNAASGISGFGNVLRSSSGTQNDSITFEFLGERGIYTIGLSHQTRTDAGKYDVYIDGVLQGAGGTWDGYAGSTGYSVTEVAGFNVKSTGRHTIRLVMASKNASSSAYKGSIFGIALTRTADLTT